MRHRFVPPTPISASDTCFLTVREAAELLRLPIRDVRAGMACGQIPVAHRFGLFGVDQPALMRMLRSPAGLAFRRLAPVNTAH